MYELYPYFTNDGSVGLYSPEADDIYHSTYGALTEAYEKFIFPANLNEFLKKNSEIKILDICYGIGYNSKSFLNYFLDFLYTETIHTNNNKNKKSLFYNGQLYTNNKKYKVFIHAIDKDKILANLSPFFITQKNNINNNKLNFNEDKIKKMLSGKTASNFKLKKEVSILLLEKLKNNIDCETESILFSKKYSQFFDRTLIDLYRFLKLKRYESTPLEVINCFLHNIYYKYISYSYKMVVRTNKLLSFNFKLDIDDARNTIIKDNNIYNYIFLDAFTPAKCPCLWTVDFFKLLYERLDNSGMLLTYSNSSAVRSAFINAGFYVGKIFSKTANKFTGTVAVKNKDLIVNELSEFDLGLMKTKAGIFYRDENLNASNEAIIKQHEIDVKNSNLISSSKYIKSFRKGSKYDI